MDKTAQRQVEQGLMLCTFSGDFVALLRGEKTARNEEGEMLVESKMEVVGVGFTRA